MHNSQIIVKPEFFGSKNKQRNVFKLLQLALAELAEKTDGQSNQMLSSSVLQVEPT